MKSVLRLVLCLENPFRMRLMQDGETSHTAQATLNLLQAHRFYVLSWPYKSPELNAVEHILDAIGRVVRNRDHVNVRQLQQFVKDGWNGIARRTCLRRDMVGCYQSITQANDGHTGY